MQIKQDEVVKIWDQDLDEWVVKTCSECHDAHIHTEMKWDTFSSEVDEQGWPKHFEEGSGGKPAYVQERCQECGYSSGLMDLE